MADLDQIHQLQEELREIRVERDNLHALLVDRRLDTLESTVNSDHEKRLRVVEEVATKFNFLMALSIGGGALSGIVLLRAALGF